MQHLPNCRLVGANTNGTTQDCSIAHIKFCSFCHSCDWYWSSADVFLCAEVETGARQDTTSSCGVNFYSKAGLIILILGLDEVNSMFQVAELWCRTVATVEISVQSAAFHESGIQFIVSDWRRWNKWVYHSSSCVLRWTGILFRCRQDADILDIHHTT